MESFRLVYNVQLFMEFLFTCLLAIYGTKIISGYLDVKLRFDENSRTKISSKVIGVLLFGITLLVFPPTILVFIRQTELAGIYLGHFFLSICAVIAFYVFRFLTDSFIENVFVNHSRTDPNRVLTQAVTELKIEAPSMNWVLLALDGNEVSEEQAKEYQLLDSLIKWLFYKDVTGWYEVLEETRADLKLRSDPAIKLVKWKLKHLPLVQRFDRAFVKRLESLV